MNNIIYIGMDVHSTNYTLASYTYEARHCFAVTTVKPACDEIIKYIAKVKENFGAEADIVCGYEAGCLGYSLYRQLAGKGINCIIVAPTSLPVLGKKEIKTDKRDAMKIAQALANGTYSAVAVPSEEDAAVKSYIRMRDSHKEQEKHLKQKINAFCLAHGFHYTDGANKWTLKYFSWLKQLALEDIDREIMDEYLATLSYLAERIKRFDDRIDEFARTEHYSDKVKKLSCFTGIKTHTAMALITESGDFSRFRKAEQYAAFLGLVPGESSSGNNIQRTAITKTGNCHLRKLLIEAAQCFSRGRIGTKGQLLKKRQAGNAPEIIEYADKANDRLRRKIHNMKMKKNKPHNVAVTAAARELACFVWGMMNNRIDVITERRAEQIRKG